MADHKFICKFAYVVFIMIRQCALRTNPKRYTLHGAAQVLHHVVQLYNDLSPND